MIGDAELEDGKKAAKIMEGVLQRGDKGYQEARQKIIDGLKAQGSPAVVAALCASSGGSECLATEA